MKGSIPPRPWSPFSSVGGTLPHPESLVCWVQGRTASGEGVPLHFCLSVAGGCLSLVMMSQSSRDSAPSAFIIVESLSCV